MVGKKLIIALIGQDVENVIRLCLDSIKSVADYIVFVDGGSKDDTMYILQQEYPQVHIIEQRYEHENKGANGKARNVYLEYVKKHFDGEWCLVLDPDECVDQPDILRKFLDDIEKREDIKGRQLMFNPRMEHFIYSLRYIDATQEKHFCPCRLFTIHNHLYYEEVEHPVLHSHIPILNVNLEGFTIFHFAYAKAMFELKKKYLNHLEKSNIHEPEFLDWWYHAHLLGEYPIKAVNIDALPKVIKEHFIINDDYLYFRNRGMIEEKHWMDAHHWNKFFQPKKALVCGCGMGQRVYTLRAMGVQAFGFDINKYAIERTNCKDIDKYIKVDDITKIEHFQDDHFDLVVCYDVLEHLDPDSLSIALEKIYKVGKENFLFSIPFIGDPNLDADPTHKIKQTKQWWIEQIQKAGFQLRLPPKHFLYKHQIILAKK